MSSSVSIFDVAKAAGVSICTVSRVINGRTAGIRISATTRQRVLTVARQLGYQADPTARDVALRKPYSGAKPQGVISPRNAQTAEPAAKRREIGVILSAASSAETLGLIPGLIPTLASADYQLVVVTLPADPATVRERVNGLLTDGIAGLLCCPTVYPAVSALVAGKCPTIVLWQGAGQAMLKSVGSGQFTAGSQEPKTEIRIPESVKSGEPQHSTTNNSATQQPAPIIPPKPTPVVPIVTPKPVIVAPVVRPVLEPVIEPPPSVTPEPTPVVVPEPATPVLEPVPSPVVITPAEPPATPPQVPEPEPPVLEPVVEVPPPVAPETIPVVVPEPVTPVLEPIPSPADGAEAVPPFIPEPATPVSEPEPPPVVITPVEPIVPTPQAPEPEPLVSEPVIEPPPPVTPPEPSVIPTPEIITPPATPVVVPEPVTPVLELVPSPAVVTPTPEPVATPEPTIAEESVTPAPDSAPDTRSG